MSNLEVETLSPEEHEALEKDLEKIYGLPPTQQPEHTNKALDSLFKNFGTERINNRGKKILPARVFKRMLAEDIPFEDEYIYVQSPDGSVASVPARKHIKYFAEGRRLVEDEEMEPQKVENTRDTIYINGKPYSIFLCSDKYSDCDRLFDSKRGRNNHWKADHEQAWGKKKVGKYAKPTS